MGSSKERVRRFRERQRRLAAEEALRQAEVEALAAFREHLRFRQLSAGTQAHYIWRVQRFYRLLRAVGVELASATTADLIAVWPKRIGPSYHNYGFHRLRHTFGTVTYEATKDLRRVQK